MPPQPKKEAFVGQSTTHCANRLNDLRDRWHIQRTGKLPPLYESSPEPPKPKEISLPQTIQEARSRQREVGHQIDNIHSLLNGLPSGDSSRTWLNERLHVLRRLSSINKNFIRDWSNITPIATLQELITSYDPELYDMAIKVLPFKQRDKHSPKIPKEEFQKLCTQEDAIRDVLMERKLRNHENVGKNNLPI